MIGWAAALALLVPPQEPEQPSVRKVTLGHFGPLAVLDVTPALRLYSTSYSLYAPFSAQPPAGERYVAWRREARRWSRPTEVQWVVASECTGAEDRLLELESLTMPRVDVPTLGRDDQQGPPLDGITYDLWFKYGTWPDGFSYEASVSSNVDTPLAQWAERFVETMEPCWSDKEPPAWNGSQRRAG